MCAIFGYAIRGGLPHRPLIDSAFAAMSRAAEHRGRDNRNELSGVYGDLTIRVGWVRATPTTEPDRGCKQPYWSSDGKVAVFHNGTIANDRELGNPEGQVDSAIIPEVLAGCDDLVEGLSKLKGSFALAIISPWGLHLAANYKPLYYVERDGVLYFASLEWMLDSVVSPFISPRKLPPYTCLDVSWGKVRHLPVTHNTQRVLVVCSGGLDSTVVATKYAREGKDVTLLHFDYGCKAATREAERIEAIAERLGCKVISATLPGVSVAGSSITSGSADISESIAGAEFAHEWVPARNLQMLAIACGVAEAHGMGIVAYGANLEESGAYPDNEEELVWLLNKAMPNVTADGVRITIEAPVGNLMKHEIVKLGLELDAPFDLTWSCYRGGEHHCGHCGPCFMRSKAFERNGTPDPVFQH